MKFGIPNRRSKKVEQHPDTPVLYVSALPVAGSGKNHKIEINKKAIEVMGLVPGNDNVCFSFDNDLVHIIKSTGAIEVEDKDHILVRKNKSISHAGFVKTIFNTLGLAENEDHTLYLLNTGLRIANGNHIFEVRQREFVDTLPMINIAGGETYEEVVETSSELIPESAQPAEELTVVTDGLTYSS